MQIHMDDVTVIDLALLLYSLTNQGLVSRYALLSIVARLQRSISDEQREKFAQYALTGNGESLKRDD